ncbi:hypothetical protein DY000_02006108 [Brassica cretica]|uniref:Embryo-specific protein ATS3B n=1 Tax=Brassica cretica TaxID=69181 RepID=A0ABQ7CM76_BRACR|nr:hypothetical protein DY000_02006108 [Brassica cretica]
MVSRTRFFTLLCFAFSTFLAVSESKLLEPHAAESFNVSLIQKLGASCSYTVIISTSCSSSRYTRDQISIAFGDAYGNQLFESVLDDSVHENRKRSLCFMQSVFYHNKLPDCYCSLMLQMPDYNIHSLALIYAPRLDDPSTKTFEQCSSDTFEINGPCTYQICYVYLYRSGPDGWIPESVKIYSHDSKAVTFPYNTNVPDSIWYGFNYCNSASDSNALAIALGRIVLILLGFIVAGTTLLL